MFKMSRLILMSGLILIGTGFATAQMPPPPGVSGMPSGQMSPGIAAMQKAQGQLLKESSPELYAFQERLRKIDAEIEKTLESFSKKRIDKDEARAELLPLVEREQKIQNDPDYLVEQRLAQVYYSSPKYQANMKRIMDAFNKKMMEKQKKGKKRKKGKK